jgi:hypothetical protein
VGAEQLLLGSDYPFPMRDSDPVLSIRQAVTDADALEATCRRNALELLGRVESDT